MIKVSYNPLFVFVIKDALINVIKVSKEEKLYNDSIAIEQIKDGIIRTIVALYTLNDRICLFSKNRKLQDTYNYINENVTVFITSDKQMMKNKNENCYFINFNKGKLFDWQGKEIKKEYLEWDNVNY